jgi:hypothetical protein
MQQIHFFFKKINIFRYENPPNPNQIFTSIIRSFIRSILFKNLFTKSPLRFGRDLVRFGEKSTYLGQILPNLNGDLINKFLNKIERIKLRIIDAKIWLYLGGFHIEKF